MTIFVFSILYSVAANVCILLQASENAAINIAIAGCIVLSLVFLGYPTLFCKKKKSRKIQSCFNGVVQLKTFLISCQYSFAFMVYVIVTGGLGKNGPKVSALAVFGHGAVLIIAELLLFFSGIIRIYISSSQISIKWKIIGVIVGMVPVVNLFVLMLMLTEVSREVKFENDKMILNEGRADVKLCATKYPILLVHGVFFRDSNLLNYWGRIPEELEKNGATIYYGKQESAASVEECGQQIADRVRDIIRKTGCEKVNIIAHSKGGLDSRCAICNYGIEDMVASLTTINTPHRGCEFAEYLLEKIPVAQKDKIANTYNAALRKVGDDKPDFISAVTDLTKSSCEKRNEELLDSSKVYYQSVGSCLKYPVGGRFPLNLTTMFVKHFDGKNDGLVGEESFEWGENYTFLENKGSRGISHADMIDLNRENIDGFDVREFYVKLVHGLKLKGM